MPRAHSQAIAFARALAALLAVFVVCQAPLAHAAPKRGLLTEVADGDTVTVEFRSGREESVRLIGIDTPELAHFGDPEECGAARATAAMERFIGRRVRLRRDFTQAARDRYDRLLRYVDTVKGGKDIGRSQLARGLANVYVFEDPFTRLPSYQRAADAARDAGRGLWSACGGDFHRPK
jgi:endonuclease YncB( thermonuclease family)